MDKSLTVFIVMVGCINIYCFSFALNSYGQGLIEHGAVNGMAGTMGGSLNNKSTVHSLSKIYRNSFSVSGAGNSSGQNSTGSTSNSLTTVRRKDFSSRN